MSLSVEQCEAIVSEFKEEYPGISHLEFRIKQTAREIYGEQNAKNLGKIKGAYSPSSGVVAIISSSIDSKKDLAGTLRHELIGHYGLNTLEKGEKLALLENISALAHACDLPAKAKIFFDNVMNVYHDKTRLVQAEEIFCALCESKMPPDFQYNDYRIALSPN